MATWYVAPDATTTAGVTVQAIGATGYGTSWAKAAKWSDFNTTNGVWKTLFVTGDKVVFLQGKYLLSALTGGWATLNSAFPTVALTSQKVDGSAGTAQFVGTRTWPWPNTALSNFVTTTIDPASNGLVLPQATITVASTTGFPSSGSITVGGSAVAYTTVTATTFAGCTGGTATLATNQKVAVTNTATAGETFMVLKYGTNSFTVSNLAFKNMQYSFTTTGLPSTTVAAASDGLALPQATINVASTAGFPASGTAIINVLGSNISYTGLTGTTFTGCTSGAGTLATGLAVVPPIPNLGTLTQTNMTTVNVAGCGFTTQTKTDGQIILNQTGCKFLGYSIGNARVWGAYNLTDVVVDSEFQWTTTDPATASQTYGANTKDAQVSISSGIGVSTATRVIGRNNRGGTSGGSYQQGDALIAEENTSLTVTDCITYGSGDRGIDMKCAGTVLRHTSFGDGYACAHHMDTFPLNIYLATYYTAKRPGVTTTPSGCVQASGWIAAYQSVFNVLPTVADVANNPHVAAVGNVDVSKFQSSIYGSNHRGLIQFNDVLINLGTTAGATETSGFTATADNARVAAMFNLTPGGSYLFKVRAAGYDGAGGLAFSAYTPTVAFQMDAPSLGDVTAPATPTGLTTTAVTGGLKHQFDWTNIAQDAGTNVQGYVLAIDFGDTLGYINSFPGKTKSPVILSGFRPGITYNVKVAAYDGNGNLSAFTAAVPFTTAAAGNPVTSSVAVPTAQAQAALWANHPKVAGLQWGAPATGTVAFYEVADNAGVIVARTFPIVGSDSTPTYTTVNRTLRTV